MAVVAYPGRDHLRHLGGLLSGLQSPEPQELRVRHHRSSESHREALYIRDAAKKDIAEDL